MLQPVLSRTALIFVSSAIAVLSVACNQDKQNIASDGNAQQPASIGGLVAVQPSVEPTPPLVNPEAQLPKPVELEPSFFELGLDKATSALTISQSAQSPEDWDLVAKQFKEAIALMRKVRKQSPDFAIAQTKITDYRRQVKYAQHKANPTPPPATETQRVVIDVPQKTSIPKYNPPLFPPIETKLSPLKPALPPPSALLNQNQQVFIVPIKRRVGGTPIIEVTFNGQKRFEMILDTGASGTVITQEIANALAIVPVGRAKANTASSKAVEFPVGYVNSMEVGGVKVNRVPVAIAGVELETGLLGHDFFGNYDVTIKRNVIEFRPQLRSEINSVETGLTPATSSKLRQFVQFP